MNYTEFENKVKSMNAHDIIMAMVEGLRNPRTEIDMHTFGEIHSGICYGCAATNTVLHIMEANTQQKVIKHMRAFNHYISYFFDQFQLAINCIRCGDVNIYNYHARNCDCATIKPIPGQDLPYLWHDYTEEELDEFVKLAKYQLTV